MMGCRCVRGRAEECRMLVMTDAADLRSWRGALPNSAVLIRTASSSSPARHIVISGKVTAKEFTDLHATWLLAAR